MFASRQEEIIHGLSGRILGTQYVFCPEVYGHSKEPADIAWVVNRCAILMYLTKKDASFEKKKRHNMAQLHRWLRKWKSGVTLTGSVGGEKYKFDFSDIDHVIGISVVDGGETWCEYHPEQVMHSSDYKLSACATFSGQVMSDLALADCEPRDLIYWISLLQSKTGSPITSEEMRETVRNKIIFDTKNLMLEIESYLKQLQLFLNKDFSYDENRKMIIQFIGWSKHTKGDPEVARLLADLTFIDVAWFALVTPTLQAATAPKGRVGPLGLSCSRHSSGYHLKCSAYAGLEIMSNEPNQVRLTGPGLEIATLLDFGSEAPHRMMLALPRVSESELQTAVKQLRDSVVQ